MRAIAQVESDGRLTIAADVLSAAGFHPGDRVEVEPISGRVLVAAERSVDDVFTQFTGILRGRPPMSLDEIVAEQREMRGHDDLEMHDAHDLD